MNDKKRIARDIPTVKGRRGIVNATQPELKAGRRVGRPEGRNGKGREHILDAAEKLFSDLGYAGTTLREVCAAAEVTQGLINYYFGSKHALFGEVFLRRATKVAQQRMDGLAQLRTHRGRLDLADVVRAFLLPTLMLRNTPQGTAFLRLQARVHTEPPSISYKLRQSAYGESTQAYIDAVSECLPHLSLAQVHWRVTLMIGTYLYAVSDTHRKEEMEPAGMYDPDDFSTLTNEVTRFVVQGMR